MKAEEWWSSLPRGIRLLLSVSALLYLISILAEWSEAYDVRGLLGLSGVALWRGEAWRVITHLLVPANLFDLLMNGFAIAVLGPRLQRAWTAGQFWAFCAIAAMGTAAAKILLLPGSGQLFLGLTGVSIGLMAAWLKLFGAEQVLALGMWRTSVRNVVLLGSGIFLLMALFGCGAFMEGVVPIFGGVVGFLYLTLRWRRNMTTPGQWRSSERIGRLEL